MALVLPEPKEIAVQALRDRMSISGGCHGRELAMTIFVYWRNMSMAVWEPLVMETEAILRKTLPSWEKEGAVEMLREYGQYFWNMTRAETKAQAVTDDKLELVRLKVEAYLSGQGFYTWVDTETFKRPVSFCIQWVCP